MYWFFDLLDFLWEDVFAYILAVVLYLSPLVFLYGIAVVLRHRNRTDKPGMSRRRRLAQYFVVSPIMPVLLFALATALGLAGGVCLEGGICFLLAIAAVFIFFLSVLLVFVGIVLYYKSTAPKK